MARTRSLSDLRNDAYKLSDLEGFTDRYPTADVTRYINQGISELWDLLVSARGYSYYGRPYYSDFTITDQNALTMPTTSTFIRGMPIDGDAATMSIKLLITVSGLLGTARFNLLKNGTASDINVLTASSVVIGQSGFIFECGYNGASAYFSAGDYITYNVSKPTTVADKVTYELPSDFYKLHKLYLSNGTTTLDVLERLSPVDEPALRVTQSTSCAYPGYYEIRDHFYDILPKPSSTWTINMYYVPTARQLITDSDTFDGINGWEDYVVAYAARKMLHKEGDFEAMNMVQQDLNKLKERIQNLAVDRDTGTPKKVQDVRHAIGRGKRSWFSYR